MASYWLAKSLTLIGLLYAVYRSFKVLKVHRGGEHNAETNRMLMLWVVLAFNALFEQYGEFLVSWMLFYYEIKCAVLVWLLLPQSQGPGWAFNSLVHPLMQHLRFRVHRDVKPILSHAAASGIRGSQAALLSSAMSGLGAAQLRSVEAALTAQVAAIQSEQQRRAAGGAVSGAALLATGPAPRPLRPAAGHRRRSSSLDRGEPPSPVAALPPPPPEEGGEGGGVIGWLSHTRTSLAEGLGLTSAPDDGEQEGGEGKKDQ